MKTKRLKSRGVKTLVYMCEVLDWINGNTHAYTHGTGGEEMEEKEEETEEREQRPDRTSYLFLGKSLHLKVQFSYSFFTYQMKYDL